MNKPKKAELMAEIGSFKTERIALNERLARYQDELAAARERISSIGGWTTSSPNARTADPPQQRAVRRGGTAYSNMEERFELIAVLAAPPKANWLLASAAGKA